MTLSNQAEAFRALHNPKDPLILYNVWDAATAKAACDVGALAVATGSWSVAAAQGYSDGQNIPLDFVVQIVSRIVGSIDVPVSVDFECGYADDPASLVENFKKIIGAGAVGINFEDQIIGRNIVQLSAEQARRIEILANEASKSGVDIFINARTDLFLQQKDTLLHESLLDDALMRERTYADAGASGFFVPGLSNENIISALCERARLPVNVMTKTPTHRGSALGELGVSRISYGPHPFLGHVETFKRSAALAITRA